MVLCRWESACGAMKVCASLLQELPWRGWKLGIQRNNKTRLVFRWLFYTNFWLRPLLWYRFNKPYRETLTSFDHNSPCRTDFKTLSYNILWDILCFSYFLFQLIKQSSIPATITTLILRHASVKFWKNSFLSQLTQDNKHEVIYYICNYNESSWNADIYLNTFVKL